MKGVKVEVGISQIGASEATSPLSLATGPGAQCIRIGVMKDNFVFRCASISCFQVVTESVSE